MSGNSDHQPARQESPTALPELAGRRLSAVGQPFALVGCSSPVGHRGWFVQRPSLADCLNWKLEPGNWSLAADGRVNLQSEMPLCRALTSLRNR